MIEMDHGRLALSRQCELLDLCRSSLYYKPRGVSNTNLELMAKIDRLYLKHPFYGYRKITAQLQREGHTVNRKRVRRLMKLMGLEAIYQRPRTSRSNPEHQIYPYLLRDLEVTRVNQVWATDITYIPMKHGFIYLVLLMDWHSRYVLSWKLSNTLEVDFCTENLEEALERFGSPEVHNSDHGSQFTSPRYVNLLIDHDVQISMDGRGRCMDNIFNERLWRSVKYEEVYLRAYETIAEARASLEAYFQFYNEERLHEAFGYRTPQEVFDAGLLCGYVENATRLHTYPQGQQQPTRKIFTLKGEDIMVTV